MGKRGTKRVDLRCRMLALVRSRAGLCSVQHARWLCAAPDPVKMVANLEESIARAKIIVASEPKIAYMPEQFLADGEAGKIDVLKLGEVFKDDPDAKKMMMKKASQINELKKKQAAMGTPAMNWADLEAKLTSVGLSGVVDAFKPEYETHLAALKKVCDEGLAKNIADVEADLKSTFEGPNGLIALAAKRDKEVAAQKMVMLEELESLAHEVKNLDTLTVAEVLEKNPAWKEAIEEDLKNHNWGSEVPASLKAAKAEAAADEVKAIS